MENIFKKFALLKSFYADDPESLNKIEEEMKRVSEVIYEKEYSERPETQRVLEFLRRTIIETRLKLATNREFTEIKREQLFYFVDALKVVLALYGMNYENELAQIDSSLAQELARLEE